MPLQPGCAVTCYDGAGRVQDGDVTQLTIAGLDVSQVHMLHMPPLGLTNDTGEATPYREIWLLVPLRDHALMIQAFYRDGDVAAEQETLAAYDELLRTLRPVP